MKEQFQSRYFVDDSNAPEGGQSYGTGFCIAWQRGSLGRGDDRLPPNGAFVETIIDVARERLQHYQGSRFACQENAQAIIYLTQALDILNQRTQRREKDGVEGTLQGK